MSDGINYGKLMHQAMQGLLRTLLSDVAENGAPQDDDDETTDSPQKGHDAEVVSLDKFRKH